MDYKMTNSDLIERLEASTGPDRELDADIAWAFGWRPTLSDKDALAGFYYERCKSNRGNYIKLINECPSGKVKSTPKATASIDSAMTLIPNGWAIELRKWPDNYAHVTLYETHFEDYGSAVKRVHGKDDAKIEFSHKLIPHAIIIASLKAMEEYMKTLTWHNDAALKQKALDGMRAHRAADELVKDHYIKANGSFSGGAVGCVLRDLTGEMGEPDSPYELYSKAAGLPEWLAHLHDYFFENLPEPANQQFAEDLIDAVPVGVDLTSVYHKFMIWVLTDEEHGSRQYSDKGGQAVTDLVVKLHQRVISGDIVDESEWDAAWDVAWDAAWDVARTAGAARDAARTAGAACYAARAAARATARTAGAARDAARDASWAARAAAWAAGAAARTAAWAAARAAGAARAGQASALLSLLRDSGKETP